MAASSADGIPSQLATLLGREAVQIRKTDVNLPQISVINVVAAITGQTQSNSAVAFKRLQQDHLEAIVNISDFKFKGRGQRETP